ncbi:MAG: glycosyltransferase, partial [Bryocella sp.]
MNAARDTSGADPAMRSDLTTKPRSIASVTVAYNAAHLLPRQLDALARQTHALAEIIVVDNASTDNTLELLAHDYPHVTVLRLEENTGAAGGCAAGWKYAVGRGHEWVWDFDNDSVPGDDALASLLRGYEMAGDAERIGIVVPLPVDAASGMPYPPLRWQDGLVRPDAETLAQEIWFADVAVASGSLIRRSVIERIGLPRADFFMDFFDFEYCLRARAAGFRLMVVRDCVFGHEIGATKTVRLMGRERTWSGHAPWREFYVGRNVTYAVFHLYPSGRAKVWLLRHLLQHGIAILLFG